MALDKASCIRPITLACVILKCKDLLGVLGSVSDADSENQLYFYRSGHIFEINHFLEMLSFNYVGRKVAAYVITNPHAMHMRPDRRFTGG